MSENKFRNLHGCLMLGLCYGAGAMCAMCRIANNSRQSQKQFHIPPSSQAKLYSANISATLLIYCLIISLQKKPQSFLLENSVKFIKSKVIEISFFLVFHFLKLCLKNHLNLSRAVLQVDYYASTV